VISPPKDRPDSVAGPRRFAFSGSIVAGFVVCIGGTQAGFIDPYYQLILMFVGVNIILTVSLNLINGYMGEFSCGHAGFMAVGAYVSSVLSMWLFGTHDVLGPPALPPGSALLLFPVVLAAGAVAAALAGLLVAVPSFRTRGDYLAIITLAVNYIVKSAIENMEFVGGARGFMGMKQVEEAMQAVVPLPWVMTWIFIATVATVWTVRRFISSVYGRGVISIREDETAAELMSIDTKRLKMLGFMLSSGLAGLAGGLFAHILGYINPGSFTILKSTEILVMIYLGGMGSLSGSVLSAVGFTVLLEVLRPLQVIKWVAIPLLLILLMLKRPEGLMGSRELGDVFPKLRSLYRPMGN